MILFHSDLCFSQFADSQHRLKVYMCDLISNKKTISIKIFMQKHWLTKSSLLKQCLQSLYSNNSIIILTDSLKNLLKMLG